MFSDWSDRGRCFSSSGEWCLWEHLSVVSEGMCFSETICSVSNVQCLVWSGADVFLLQVNGVYQSIYQLFRRECASQKRSVVCLMFSAWSDRGRCFLLQVNGVYQSIYQLFRRECASQKRSVVCLMFSAWSDRGRCFSSSGEWCLSEHLSVVSEGMASQKRSVVCLMFSDWSDRGRCFSSSGEWCLSEHHISCFGGNGLLRNDL